MKFDDYLTHEFQVPSLAQCSDVQDVVGVARFMEFPAFDTASVHTFAYRQDSVSVTTVEGVPQNISPRTSDLESRLKDLPPELKRIAETHDFTPKKN